MLYLLKSAATTEYLQENLSLLAARPGTAFAISYASRWIARDVLNNIHEGDDACIVFGDRPYTWFTPVRRASVATVVASSGGVWTINVTVGAYVRNADVSSFSKRFRELNQGWYFVVQDLETPLAFVSAEEDTPYWQSVIDSLQTSPGGGLPSRYAASIFLRPGVLLDDHGRAVLPDGLTPNQPYYQEIHCYAPGIDSELRGYSLVAEPLSGGLAVEGSLPLDDKISIEFEPSEGVETKSEIEFAIWVSPNRAQSTTLNFRYLVDNPVVEAVLTPAAPVVETAEAAVAEVAPVSTTLPRLQERDLRAILNAFYQIGGAGRAADILKLIDDVLAPLAPEGNHYLNEQRGLCLYHLERWEETYQQLSMLNPGLLSPAAVVAWFVSACRAKKDVDFRSILEDFTAWKETALVEQLVAALEHVVSEDRLLALLELICYSTTSYQRRVWEVVRDRFTQPHTILAAVEIVVNDIEILSAGDGARYLADCIAAYELSDPALLQQAVELGSETVGASGELDAVFKQFFEQRLTQANTPEKLFEEYSWIEGKRGHLRPETYTAALEKVAGRMIPVDQHLACQIYLDLARACRQQGEFEDAERFLRQAAGTLVPALAEKLERERQEWTEAVERLKGVRELRENMRDAKLSRLLQHTHGKRAVFVGGDRSIDLKRIETTLKLAEAKLVLHFHRKRGELDRVRDMIKQGKVDYVVDFLDKGGHRNLKGDCDLASVHYIPTRYSSDPEQIVRAFASFHRIRLDE